MGYSYLWAPIVLFGALGGVMKYMERNTPEGKSDQTEEGR